MAKVGKTLKFAGRMLCFVLVSLLIGVSLVFANARMVLHKQLPMIGGYGQAVVLSGSMSPEIEVNDLLIIKKCDKYKIGDIITFVDSSNDLVTHRIVYISEEEVITQGDANNIADQPFEPERIQGKVVHIIPKIGRLTEMLQNPVIVIMIVVIFIMSLRASHNKARDEKNERLGDLKAEIEKLKNEMENELENENKKENEIKVDKDSSPDNQS